jgi:peptidoglycan/xylan/chitin deacetylase (PgdA/CDA1 family)
VVPYTLTYNDSHYSLGHLGGPDDFLSYCKRGLDYLWDEGAASPKMMSIGLHPRLSGQAARASALREFIEHALTKGEIWIATRAEIASWWMMQHPSRRS